MCHSKSTLNDFGSNVKLVIASSSIYTRCNSALNRIPDMAPQRHLFVCLLKLSICFFLIGFLAAKSTIINPSIFLRRSSFPPNFLFGTSSSAYQYEGAANEDGRGVSIWDTFTHKHPEKIKDRTNGDIAVDFYHRYKEDVELMKYIGLNSFRFSISWTRILPYGKLSEGVNKEGISFYNNLINELLSKGIEPFVTIFHWDSPQALEDEYGGFLSPLIVDDFRDFAELCFREFGDRVKHWTTFNEPWTFATGGYDSTTLVGTMAPGRCSAWLNMGCPAGNSAIEPYLVGHHILLSHAAAAKLYMEKYKPSQEGRIGIALATNWFVPLSTMETDIEAAQRALDFFYGWFLEPVTYGDYPKVMHSTLGHRLPKFTPEQSNMVNNSIDFLGVNYYTANYASPMPISNRFNVTFSTDLAVNLTSVRNGIPIGPPTGVSSFYSYPRGLEDLLLYTRDKYKNPVIYITENGIGDADVQTAYEGVDDPHRMEFYTTHFFAVKAAVENGVNVKGFFVWSFLDTFEWNSGHTLRFGLNFVDYKNGLKRYPKRSAFWLQQFLKTVVEPASCQVTSMFDQMQM